MSKGVYLERETCFLLQLVKEMHIVINEIIVGLCLQGIVRLAVIIIITITTHMQHLYIYTRDAVGHS